MIKIMNEIIYLNAVQNISRPYCIHPHNILVFYSVNANMPSLFLADVEVGFLPWLMEKVDEEVGSEVRARTVLDAILRDVVKDRHQAYRRLEEQVAQARLANEASKALSDGQLPEASEEPADAPPAEAPPAPEDAEAAPAPEPAEAPEEPKEVSRPNICDIYEYMYVA